MNDVQKMNCLAGAAMSYSRGGAIKPLRLGCDSGPCPAPTSLTSAGT